MTPVREKQEIGLPVTNFSLPLIGGSGRFSLENYLEGKRGAVVVFWSGECSHCNRYDEYLNTFTTRHPDLGLVAIASRHGETAEKLKATIAARKLTFPILHDASQTVARQWYTQQTPRAFLVDAQQKLLYRGAIDNFKFRTDPEFVEYLEPAIAAFRAGQPIEKADTASFGCAIMSVYYILPKPV
jgi:peroxiredoxin